MQKPAFPGNIKKQGGTKRIKKENEEVIPISVRLGPFSQTKANEVFNKLNENPSSGVRIELSGSYQEKDTHWVWVEGLRKIRTLHLN